MTTSTLQDNATATENANADSNNNIIRAYAAMQAGGELERYDFDAGELKVDEVEIAVSYCGICHSDLSIIDSEWGQSQ